MKLVSNQINPHFTLSDSLQALSSLLLGPSHKKLEASFETHFLTENILFTNTARSALGLICDTVKPDKSKKIALPAFICAVVATPFLSRGYEIEWIDTDENGLIDVQDFERKASNVGLVVVPHVFGQLAPLAEIKTIAQPLGIFVVEDSAHAIRQFLPGFKSLADAQILSFGREKVVSCVSGGALIWPENSEHKADFLELKTKLQKPSPGWVIKHAFQPVIFCLSVPWWQRGGKVLPWLMRKLKILPLAVTASEKQGQENIPIRALGLAQKRILTRQLKKREIRTIHAHAMALAWKETLQALMPDASIVIGRHGFRTILVTPAPHYKSDLVYKLKQIGSRFHLSEWDGIPISPKGIDYKAFGYVPGQCKQAEYYARTYLTFPTNIKTSKSDIKAFAKYPFDT